jgi:hypothetical protein
MTSSETMRIERMDVPATPQPGSELIDRWDTYATVSLRGISAHIERFTYWDPRDNEPEQSVLFEVRINGLPDTCSISDVVSEVDTLCDLAAVFAQAANLLFQVRRVHGNRSAAVTV